MEPLPKSEEAGSGSRYDMSMCVCSGLENIERIKQLAIGANMERSQRCQDDHRKQKL